jgi:outer membrane immunogenic protein
MTSNIKIIGAVAALVFAPTAVLAADMAVKAPLPAPIYDWTGFYIGAAAGGSIGTSDHLDQATGLSNTSGYNLKGGLAGGTLGYNWQMSSFVIGFEGDASWVGEYGSSPDQGPNGLAFAAATGAPPFPGFPTSAPQPQFASFTKETWLTTARARFGYAVNNLLFFGTGGFAAAGTEAGIKSTGNGALLASASSTRTGWTAGGGIEWGFAPNWSTKFEILFMKFDSVALNTTVAEGPRTVPLEDTIARFGVNYRFGGPAVARY